MSDRTAPRGKAPVGTASVGMTARASFFFTS